MSCGCLHVGCVLSSSEGADQGLLDKADEGYLLYCWCLRCSSDSAVDLKLEEKLEQVNWWILTLLWPSDWELFRPSGLHDQNQQVQAFRRWLSAAV